MVFWILFDIAKLLENQVVGTVCDQKLFVTFFQGFVVIFTDVEESLTGR